MIQQAELSTETQILNNKSPQVSNMQYMTDYEEIIS